MKGPAILVADDDPEVLSYLETALLCHKYPVIAAQDGDEVLALLLEHKDIISAVVLDVMMPCKDGIETLTEIRRLHPDLPVVMISGSSDPDSLADAMRAGAQEYLTKPVVHEKLLESVRRTLSLEDVSALEANSAPERAGAPVSYVQVNARMRAISEALRKTAAWNVPVVLRGESGVGKEVVARELHLLSPRADKEFVKINCVALPSELLESELFGYERGAFTGAFKSKPGKFELADGGTMLLDEIGDMDLKLQAKLLQVLQDGEFHRLGGKESVRVDVRVLVATHRDLERSIEEGTFREDLYYRLNVVSIEVPPLRERKDEILPLADHFLRKHGQDEGKALDLPEELKLAFLAYDWPGNVRELENVVRRYLVFEDAPRLARQLLMGPASRLATRAQSADRLAAGAAQAARQLSTPAAASAEGELALGQAAGAGRAGAPSSSTHAGGPAAAASGGGTGQAASGVTGSEPAGGSQNGAGSGSSGELAARFDQSEAAISSRAGRDENRGDAAPLGAKLRSPEDLTSRLERMEALLGRLVSEVSEDSSPSDDSPETNQSTENGSEIITLGELDRQRNEAESRAILLALDQTEWNRKKAARLLKTDYKALLYRMKKLGIGERGDQA